MARVLIADNSTFMRGSLKFTVEYCGHVVIDTIDDGGKIPDMYRMSKPDLLIMDVSIGGMDALSVLKAVKEIDKWALIVMTFSQGQEDQEIKANEALELGASGQIKKPFVQTEIAEELKRVLKSKR